MLPNECCQLFRRNYFISAYKYINLYIKISAMHVHLLLSSWESTVTIQQGDSDSGMKYVLILNFNLSVDPSVVESTTVLEFTINNLWNSYCFYPFNVNQNLYQLDSSISVLWDMLDSILQFHFFFKYYIPWTNSKESDRRCILRLLIWLCTVYRCPIKGHDAKMG